MKKIFVVLLCLISLICILMVLTACNGLSIVSHEHEIVIDNEVNPTCTKTGLTKGSHCSICNEVIVKQENVPATGHTEVIDAAVDPTCTEDGLSEGKHCSICNTIIKAQTKVPAKLDDPYGVCLKCNTVTNGPLAANHYVKVVTNVAMGKTVTCYYDGSIFAQFYIKDIDYTIDVHNTYDNRISVRVDFTIDYDILRTSTYYSHTAILTYVIMDWKTTVRSGSLSVNWGYSSTWCNVIESSISEHTIYINIGNYSM